MLRDDMRQGAVSAATLAVAGAVFVLTMTVAMLIAIVLHLNHGYFVYTLDDPYIHLALAENLAHGHYGIHPGEVSSPSSSILWPVLLVPFVWLGVEELAPLLINIVAAVATLVLFVRTMDQSLSISARPQRIGVLMLLGCLFIPATNLVGLIFTGMEHSLQLLLACALMLGLIVVARERRLPPWLIPVLVLGPLVRYENLALSVPALGFLFLRGYRLESFLGVLVLGVALGGFSLYLRSLDLPWLPLSVLSKSSAVSTDGQPSVLIGNVFSSFSLVQGTVLGLLGLMALATALSRQRDRAQRQLALVMVAAVMLHLLAGRYGWYSRYEMYALTFVVIGVLSLYSPSLRRYVSAEPLWKLTMLATLAVAMSGSIYLRTLVSTPTASNNIYEQQYQMHRFVTSYYRDRIAVNDLGWVSYRNENYVLDLVGLANQNVLRDRLEGNRQAVPWLRDLLHNHGVKAAMIYDSWFPVLPPEWQRVAVMHLGRERITPDHDRVSFYAVDEQAYFRLRAALGEFTRTLPEGVVLQFD